MLSHMSADARQLVAVHSRQLRLSTDSRATSRLVLAGARSAAGL